VKIFYNSTFLALLIIFTLSLFALKDLLKSGFYTSHDGETHTARIAQYYIALKDGQIPPRFAGSFYNGLGSPIFVYIYPLPYILGSILHFSGFSFVNSFKMIMALGFIFSGVFSYIWLKELYRDQKAALIGALFYEWSPYRLQLIYVRGSISEHLAYTFLPLALFSITRLINFYSRKWLAISSLFIAFILLSQNLVALLSIPVIIFYSILISISKNNFKPTILTLIAITWGLVISAFTYIPAIFERNLIRFDEAFNLVYNSHFITLMQIIRSPWGYGFDLPGTVNDMMSFQMGLAHLLILSLTIILLIYLFIKKGKKIFLYSEEFSKNNLVIILVLFALSVAIFLTIETNITKFVWKNITLLHLIDIPWRFLGVMPIFVAVIAAFFMKKTKFGLIFIFLIFALIFANRNHIRINKSLFYTDEHFLTYTGTATQFSEFSPTSRNSTSIPYFTNKDLAVNTASGWVVYTNINSNSRKITFNADVISDEAQIRINKFFFPKIIILQDNQKLVEGKDFRSHSEKSIRLDSTKDTNGFIYVTLKKGNHYLEMKYVDTYIRKVANITSLFALCLALIIVFTKNRR